MEKNAIITGASRGIGRAIALELARAGHNVIVNYASNDAAAEEARAAAEALGVRALCWKGDVSDFQSAKELVDFCKGELGSVDVLVNNAGITRDGLAMRMKEEDFDAVIAANLKSAFNMCRHALGVMMRQRSGRIINIASIAGIMGNAGQANYAASKAGLIGLTKTLAREAAGRGVTVNAIAPGFVETDMTRAIKPEILEKALESVPLRRMAQPAEIGAAAAFLAGEGAAYITGQVLVVDGGMAM